MQHNAEMPGSLCISSAGRPRRALAVLWGSGWLMRVMRCLCCGLIAFFAVFSAHEPPPVQATAISPAVAAVKRPRRNYFARASTTLFYYQRLRNQAWTRDWSRFARRIPPALPEELPTMDLVPKIWLHPRTPAGTSPMKEEQPK